MSLEQSVSQHYTHGNLEGALLAALQRAGKNLDELSYTDLALVDEFHIGGRPATRALGDQLDLPEGARVLGDGSPKIGAHGKPVLFLHPKDFCGTLVEIEQA